MKNIVLVGHGSIGSRYKDALFNFLSADDNLYIVDNNTSKVIELVERGFNAFESFEELKKKTKNITHGIVANWAPDHIQTAQNLIDIGCKRLIIEKPISSRKDELDLLKKRCKKENIFVTVHHHWSYTNILNTIKESQEKFNLGNPVGIRFFGGAVCLSTNGIHYFDLGCLLLNSIPQEITADLELDYINPRSKHLVNIGGMASYKMKNGTFIHTSFSNSNSQALKSEIIYRHGIIELNTNLQLSCYKRKDDQILMFGEEITRYGDMELFSKINFENQDTIDCILRNLFNDKNPIVSIERAEISFLMVLGAIDSHLSNKKIKFDNIKDNGICIS